MIYAPRLRAVAMAAVCFLASVATAQARPHHHDSSTWRTTQSWQTWSVARTSVRPRRHAERHSRKHAKMSAHRSAVHHSGGLAAVHVQGHTSMVAVSAAHAFQGFLNDVSRLGRIYSLSCYSPNGHMPSSKHHWGGACDVNQIARSVTSSFMRHITAIAHRWGLTDGCEWRHPDCGHIEVSGRSRYARL